MVEVNKGLGNLLSTAGKESMRKNRFTFVETDSRDFEFIGTLLKNDIPAIHIYQNTFYVRIDDLSINNSTLALIKEFQWLESTIPSQSL